MIAQLVLRAEGIGGYTYEYLPPLFRDGDPEAVASLIKARHGVSYAVFMGAYARALEDAALRVVEVDNGDAT